ncbi:hypothetical protein [Pseudomonas ogarae]|uniref:hypothetical protein n=1 Tax=Pseudomonas ogarae (strain DSM 112162 / CECT 30235 / F113) TaxID=1114970 RepID=UPI00023B4B44|nr:hypothetical protein [Pseudomonas ogarae]AEV62878.1 Hypothetical protein PSF113_2874 [Pseudomonas ogarae]
MKDPLIKARNGVHLNQVDTIAFGVGVRKVCWPDAYDDNTPKHSRIVICPFSGQSKQWVNTRENWRKARRSKIQANTERTDLADYEFFTFDGPSKKRLKERLQSCIGPDEVIYIFGHCAPGSIELSKEVSASSESITAFALAKTLKDGVSLNENFAGKIKIYGCNSALPNGTNKSFAFLALEQAG